MFVQVQAAAIDAERHRGEGSRHARHRSAALLATPLPTARPSLAARLRRHLRRDDHELTTYPCRLPDGTIGLTAVVLADREWVLVCRVA